MGTDAWRETVRPPIASALRSAGFKVRDSRNWWRVFPEVIQVVGLQKSSWGVAAGYVNVGIDLSEMEQPTDKPPLPHECPVNFRADQLWDDPHQGIDALLDLERSPNPLRGDPEAIGAGVLRVIRCLDEASTTAGLRSFVQSEWFNGMVFASVRDRLGIPALPPPASGPSDVRLPE